MTNSQDCLEIYKDAEIYDMEFDSRKEDVDFYKNILTGAFGSVLEIACGTGRLTIPLAKSGLSIQGIDLVPQMIDRAKRKSKQAQVEIGFSCADMTNFQLSKKFDTILAVANCFQHLYSTQSLLLALNHCKQHLSNDGKMYIEIFNPDPCKLSRAEDQRYLHKNFKDLSGNDVLVHASSRYEAHSQLLIFDLFYSQADRPNFHQKHVKMRCFYPLEFDHLIELAGFRILNKWGSYDKEPFGSESKKQIFELSR